MVGVQQGVLAAVAVPLVARVALLVVATVARRVVLGQTHSAHGHRQLYGRV